MNANTYSEASPNFVFDLYELTMAENYFKSGIDQNRAMFSMHFRKPPFESNFVINSGLELLLDKILNLKFDKNHIQYMDSLKSLNGSKLFSPEFLEILADFRFKGDIWAVPEGEIVFAQEPLINVEGGLLECQILESLILNIINYNSLLSTKAARICLAAGDKPVLEFGLRRGFGIDGALSGSRACYIGGCAATSNLAAGKLFNIPVSGTHAHSWVLSFDSELESFYEYAKNYAHNLVFLIDTYDTIKGVKNAIKVASSLSDPKRQFLGVRIDSGDIAYLSKKVRSILDEAGFSDVKIYASNNLDEYIIESLNFQGVKVDFWAVGTKLLCASSFDNNLGGVYKLTANLKNNVWQGKIKISNDPAKINNPGRLQVRRFYDKAGYMLADAIYDIDIYPSSKIEEKPDWCIINSADLYMQKRITDYDNHKNLLELIVKAGKLVYDLPSLDEIRKNSLDNLKKLDIGIKRNINPHIYPAGLELDSYFKKSKLIADTKKFIYAPSIKFSDINKDSF